MGAAAAIIPLAAKGVFIGNLFLNVRPGPGGNGEGFQVVPDGAVAVFQKKILVLFKAKIGAVVAGNLFGVKPLVQHSGSKKIGKFSIPCNFLLPIAGKARAKVPVHGSFL